MHHIIQTPKRFFKINQKFFHRKSRLNFVEKGGRRRYNYTEEIFYLSKERGTRPDGALVLAVSAGGQPGRFRPDGDGQGTGPAGGVAGPGADPVPARRPGRGPGGRPGHEALPPQDQALVFSMGVSAAPFIAGGSPYLAGLHKKISRNLD